MVRDSHNSMMRRKRYIEHLPFASTDDKKTTKTDTLRDKSFQICQSLSTAFTTGDVPSEPKSLKPKVCHIQLNVNSHNIDFV